MSNLKVSKSQTSNFDLKNQYADLAPAKPVVSLSLKRLEELRSQATGVPASKYGLEVICGASCETGAL